MARHRQKKQHRLTPHELKRVAELATDAQAGEIYPAGAGRVTFLEELRRRVWEEKRLSPCQLCGVELWLPTDPTLAELARAATAEDPAAAGALADWLRERDITPPAGVLRVLAKVQPVQQEGARVSGQSRLPGSTYRLSTEGYVDCHEAANLLPGMGEEEYTELKRDIREHGLRQPVWTWRGQLLDGRHRLRACRELGISPIDAREWDGLGSPVAFVLSLNLHRRHLSASQRAALAVEALPHLETEAKKRQRQHGKTAPGRKAETLPEKIPGVSGEAREQAAKLTGTNPRYVSDAAAIKEQSPELFRELRSGQTTVGRARKELQRREQRRRDAERGEVAKAPPTARERTAYHEAGHAVVGFILHAGVKEVTIRATRGGRSATDTPSAGHYAPRKLAPAPWGVMIGFAGPLAAERFAGSAPVSGSDREQIAYKCKGPGFLSGENGPRNLEAEYGLEEYSVSWGKETQGHYRSWVRSATKDLLHNPDVWRAVQALAQALLDKEHLDGTEAEALLAEYLKPAAEGWIEVPFE